MYERYETLLIIFRHINAVETSEWYGWSEMPQPGENSAEGMAAAMRRLVARGREQLGESRWAGIEATEVYRPGVAGGDLDACRAGLALYNQLTGFPISSYALDNYDAVAARRGWKVKSAQRDAAALYQTDDL